MSTKRAVPHCLLSSLCSIGSLAVLNDTCRLLKLALTVSNDTCQPYLKSGKLLYSSNSFLHLSDLSLSKQFCGRSDFIGRGPKLLSVDLLLVGQRL
eukprot:9689574-Heterocapsa_arctica.AAC.1